MSERKYGTLLHCSVVAAREVLVIQCFLFVKQEEEREHSKTSKAFAQADIVLCSDNSRDTGRRQGTVTYYLST